MSLENGKKRKREADPNDPSQPKDQPSKKTKSSGQSRQEKSERRSKKKTKDDKRARKNGTDRVEVVEEPVVKDTLASGEDFVALSEAQEEKVHKKKDKQEKKVKKDRSAEGSSSKKSTNKTIQSEKKDRLTKSNDPNKSSKDSTQPSKAEARFIVFVGNLPYEVTTEQIQAHFVKIEPFTVRHQLHKDTGKSKGFAFLEFDGYDKMKTCLSLYHHSIFDPAAPQTPATGDGSTVAAKPSKKARKINVELTAGGGGSGKERKEKIKTKNLKLDEERARRFAKEKADKEKADREKKTAPATGVNADAPGPPKQDHGSIHPSRLSRVHR